MGVAMLGNGIVMIMAAVAASLAAAGTIIAALTWLTRGIRTQRPVTQAPVGAGTVFLFDGGHLADASPAARQMIDILRLTDPDIGAVASHLSRRFPELRDRLSVLRQSGEAVAGVLLAGTDPGEQVRIDAGHGFVRLTLLKQNDEDSGADRDRIAAMEDELRTLRSIAEDAPQLIWQQDAAGQLIWANRAYLDLADRLVPPGPDDDLLWPARPLLPDLKSVEEDGGTLVQRVPVLPPGMPEPQWFEVTSVRRGPTMVHFAVDASSIIEAETGRQKFIQTLTKTFASLATGLAIFDRDRRLVLFNPAFLDLTGLPVTFLSGRPHVNSVLDRLRDMNMLPEPRNYSSWREQVAALEAAAERGTYAETWALPSGRTYRVTGRPHPEGAIAFVFEDISDEVLLTRRFRSELDTAQAVIDSLDEAIAVFSQGGTLTMTNAAYGALWGHTSAEMSDLGIEGEAQNWEAKSGPDPAWRRIRAATDKLAERSTWRETVHLPDGRRIVCRLQPLPGGSTLVGFQTDTAMARDTGWPRRPGVAIAG